MLFWKGWFVFKIFNPKNKEKPSIRGAAVHRPCSDTHTKQSFGVAQSRTFIISYSDFILKKKELEKVKEMSSARFLLYSLCFLFALKSNEFAQQPS